jgi:cytochrome b involved in lipid metabolism
MSQGRLSNRPRILLDHHLVFFVQKTRRHLRRLLYILWVTQSMVFSAWVLFLEIASVVVVGVVVTMAPDADKVRQRHASSKIQPSREEEDETKLRVATLQTLKSNEVAIDGIIYDISSFDHPGGESIHVFGGNDATAVYRMIHPYHSSKKQLQKMKQVNINLIHPLNGNSKKKFGKLCVGDRNLARLAFLCV